MSGPTKIAALIPVSDEWARNTITFRAEDIIGEALREAELDRLHGPRLGPGPAEWWPIVRDRDRRERCSIPGKHPGRWIAARQPCPAPEEH